MGRSKKSRKVGLIGVRKTPDNKPKADAPDRRKKAPKGKPAGNRHNVEQNKKSSGRSNAGPRDPRTGSKKPVPLVKPSVTTTQEKRRFANPAEELAALEADSRLVALLDKLDNDEKLTREQQTYVDEKMDRHRILCDLLGISEQDESEDKSDPLSGLDAINIDDYK